MSTENSASFPKECVAGRGKGKLRELPGKALDDMEIDLEMAEKAANSTDARSADDSSDGTSAAPQPRKGIQSGADSKKR